MARAGRFHLARSASMLLSGCALAGLWGLITGCGTSSSSATNPTPGMSAKTQATVVAAGPSLGYLWSASEGTVRPLRGVPGASQAGAALFPAGSFSAAAIAPQGSAALLEDAGGGLFAVNLQQGAQPTLVASGLPAKLHFAFAPGGARAAAYMPGSSSVLLISGLPGTPQSTTLTLTKAIAAGGSLADLAVSDTGAVLLGFQLASGSAALVPLGADGSPSTAIPLARLGGLTFLAGGNDAVFADGGSNTLYLVRSITSGAAAQALAAAKDGLNQPAGVGVSADGRWALVRNQADATLVRVDLSGGAGVSHVTCNCKPEQIQELGGGTAVFQVTAASGAPIWAIDLSATDLKPFFIPAIPTSQNAGGSGQ